MSAELYEQNCSFCGGIIRMDEMMSGIAGVDFKKGLAACVMCDDGDLHTYSDEIEREIAEGILVI
jgi:hypothetical protein